MCQACVDEGSMTQDELTAALAAGDKSVVPIIELSDEEFATEVVAMVKAAVLDGMDFKKAIDEAAELANLRKRFIAEMN